HEVPEENEGTQVGIFEGDELFTRLFQEGPRGFQIADIGVTITTPEQLRQALDDLDDQPGNVSLTTTPDGGVRYDVRFTKTLTGEADVNLSAFGGSLFLHGDVEISTDVTVHLVFGVDAQGFYIDAGAPRDAQGNPEPELTLGNIRVGGDFEAGGAFGI